MSGRGAAAGGETAGAGTAGAGTAGTGTAGTGTAGTGMAGAASGTGAGGIAGTGSTGVGGTGECVPPPSQGMCPSLCGNGVRDMCWAPTAGPCPAVMWTEFCDGSDFGATSCATRGFAGGTLICTATCLIDDSGCGECFALDASLVGCGPAPVGPMKPASFAIAATDAEVGLGLLEYDAADSATVSFARLSPALASIGVTVLDDHVAPGRTYPAFSQLAAAALPAGWVLAVVSPSDLSLRAMGADGGETGRAVVDTLPNDGFPASPFLAAQPSGGPLVVWATSAGLRASVIAADGRSATTPVDLPTPDVASYDPPTAAFVGDAFYVAFPVQTVPSAYALRLVRVGLDGTVGSPMDLYPGEPIFMPDLASGASDLRLAYAGPTTGVAADPPVTLWRRLTPAGQTLAPASQIAGRLIGVGPSFAFGDDTVVLVYQLDGVGFSISLVRVASDGSIVTLPHAVARAPSLGYVAARRGPDVVAAWLGPHGLQLARVTP